MALFKKKPEFMILHVRYTPDGSRIETARYVRNFGHFFWDWELMDRAKLIDLLKSKKRVALGRPGEALNTFEPGTPVQLVRANGEDYVRTDDKSETRDKLDGAPVF